MRASGYLAGMGLFGALVTATPVGAEPLANLKTLHNFDNAADGQGPAAGLISDDALYGTTSAGGDGKCGCGTVFKLTPNGDGSYTESILHRFGGESDGENPQAGLIVDSTGALYGTTAGGGGINRGGTVFKLTPGADGSYTESVLYSFGGYATDGSKPQAGLIMDTTGALYGTTALGGDKSSRVWPAGAGTVFKLTPGADGSYTESVLYSFPGYRIDGAAPQGGLIMDSTGALYGTTGAGGSITSFPCGGLCGTVFKLTPDGDGYAESVLYSFAGGADGQGPLGGLIMGRRGALYGTTSRGGGNCDCGTVFKLTPDGDGTYTESVLYGFKGGSGAYPFAGVIMDPTGALYGTTVRGGFALCSVGRRNCGTVFKLTPLGDGTYTENPLYGFVGGSNGEQPQAGLIMGRGGAFYGTTSGGGAGGGGTVFKLEVK